MIYIPDIHCEFVLPTYSVSTINLGPPRDAGKHFMAAHLKGRIAPQVTNQEWPWTDDAHLAANDVDQFRQLIQACATQKTSKWPDPRTVPCQLSAKSHRFRHRAELQQREELSVQSRTLLPKNNRLPEEHCHQQTDQQNERRHQDEDNSPE